MIDNSTRSTTNISAGAQFIHAVVGPKSVSPWHGFAIVRPGLRGFWTHGCSFWAEVLYFGCSVGARMYPLARNLTFLLIRFSRTIAGHQKTRTRASRSNASHAARRTIANIPVQWIARGQSMRAGDITIPGGLIYFGTLGRRPDFLRSNAHVIDPSLPVRAHGADVAGTSMPYRQRFGELTPAARLANLQWHAAGRNSSFGVGHVFLFFYGLEHRFFVDKSCNDHDAILQEVIALLDTYGTDTSFRSYATAFVTAARLWRGILPPEPTLDVLQVSYAGLAPDFRVALARRLNEGPLSAEWLLAWYLAHPEKSLRTPATRCFTNRDCLPPASMPSIRRG